MTSDQLEKILGDLGIITYNKCDDYICAEGVNGEATVFYTSSWAKRRRDREESDMKDIANHLKQMGRDSLKMELNRLLSITLHE